MNKNLTPAVGRNHNIDILKAICAIEVVVLHMPFIVKVDPHFAVPCFLMISGFFLYSPDQNKLSEKLVRAIKHIAILILWSNAVYFTYHFTRCWYKHGDFSTLLTLRDFLYTIVLNNNAWAEHLWYLNAYIYVLVIAYFLNKRGWLRVLFWIAPLGLLFVWGTMYSTCLLGVTIHYVWSRNFIGLGIPFFAMGIWAKQHFAMLQNCQWLVKGAPWFVALFTLIWAAERCLIKYFELHTWGELYISSLFLSLALFFTFTLRSRPSENWLSKIGRNDSLHLYVFHFLVAWLFKSTLNVIGLSSFMPIYKKIGPFIILPLTLLLIYLCRYVWRLCGKAKNELATRKSIK